MPRGRHASREVALALRELLSKVRLDRSHDVPYLGALAKDGETLYIDRDAPRTFPSRGGRSEVWPFIGLHEMVEDAILWRFGVSYGCGHVIAQAAERAVVQAMGHRWSEYQPFNERMAADCERKRAVAPPKGLDWKPYRQEGDGVRLRRMRAGLRRTHGRPGPRAPGKRGRPTGRWADRIRPVRR